MAGLINSATINKKDPLSSTKNYDPALYTVNPETDTVAGQMDSLLSQDSSYIQRAEAGAVQDSNSKGLLNSSMAATAGQAAAIDAALPIASQDASTYSTAGLSNQAASNQANQFNASATNTAALSQFDANTQGQLQKQQGLISSGLQREQGKISGGLQRQEGQITGKLQQQAAMQESRLMTQKAEIDRQLAAFSGRIESELSAQEAAQLEELTKLQGDLDMQLQELKGEQTMKQQRLIGSQQLDLQAMKGEQAEAIAQLEGEYQMLVETTESAAVVWNSAMTVINNAMMNPDPSFDDKDTQAAIDTAMDMMEDGLAILGGTSGLDLNSLLNFG